MEETPIFYYRPEPNSSFSNVESNASFSNLNCSSNCSEGGPLNNAVELYAYTVPLLAFFCMTSIFVNIWILSSVRWIRRKLSRTLLISLSLAGADVLSSLTLGLGLIVNSLMNTALRIDVDDCLGLGLEALRISAIITTVFHLLALAGNHYLGILKPLHYASYMTHRKTSVGIGMLWLLPIVFFYSYFSLLENEGFRSPTCNNDFLGYSKFRFIFATLFIVPFFVMSVIYIHIFIIVRRHQSIREEIRRVGTMNSRQKLRKHTNNSKSVTNDVNNKQQQMARNIKAIYTTFFILGSFLIGWMPAIVVYLLVCDDCYFKPNSASPVFMFYVHFIVNFFVILKTLLNPIIYSARMHEIKVAMRRMHDRIRRLCCRCLPGGASSVIIEASQSDLSRHPTHRTSAGSQRSSAVSRVRSYPPTHNISDTPVTSSNGSCEEMKLSLLHHSTKRTHRRKQDEISAML